MKSSSVEKFDDSTHVFNAEDTPMSKDDTVYKILEVNGAHHNPDRRRSSFAGRRPSLHPTANMSDAEKAQYFSDVTEAGEAKFHKLGWKQLTVVLITTAVALGTLSMPVVFSMLGMTGGIITTIGMGLLAVYCSFIIGQVKVKYPQVKHYSDIGPLLFPDSRIGIWIRTFLRIVFLVFLTLIVGGHCLTGTIALRTISQSGICGIVWGVVSMFALFAFALPPSFAEMAFLGYLDFVSLMAAVFITLIAAGISAKEVGFNNIPWSNKAPDLSFGDGMLAGTNVLFAYSFGIVQFSFMEEMHTPTDFPKSVVALGGVQIIIYTLVGALGYAFIGPDVKAPALLSASVTVSRVAFGVALPVIFISGAICAVTAGRFVMDTYFTNSTVRYVNTPRGWATWVALVFGVCFAGWIIASVIPIFNPLLGIISSLFNSAFSLYLPGILWFAVIKEGGMFSTKKNAILSIINIIVILIGFLIFVAGTYGSVLDMKRTFDSGKVGKPFSCSA